MKAVLLASVAAAALAGCLGAPNWDVHDLEVRNELDVSATVTINATFGDHVVNQTVTLAPGAGAVVALGAGNVPLHVKAWAGKFSLDQTESLGNAGKDATLAMTSRGLELYFEVT